MKMILCNITVLINIREKKSTRNVSLLNLTLLKLALNKNTSSWAFRLLLRGNFTVFFFFLDIGANKYISVLSWNLVYRSTSPKLNKRMSCPDALSVTAGARGVLVRSMTSDRIPDFTLPPERVQPWMSQDKKGSPITYNTQQRNNSLGSISPNLYQ